MIEYILGNVSGATPRLCLADIRHARSTQLSSVPFDRNPPLEIEDRRGKNPKIFVPGEVTSGASRDSLPPLDD